MSIDKSLDFTLEASKATNQITFKMKSSEVLTGHIVGFKVFQGSVNLWKFLDHKFLDTYNASTTIEAKKALTINIHLDDIDSVINITSSKSISP